MNGLTINMSKSAILFFIAWGLLTVSSHGQKVGTSSMQFLKVTPTAKAVSMGEAYVATAQGAEAVFWNPSGLAFDEKHDFSLDYVNWFMDVNHYSFSYAMNLGNNRGYVGVHYYSTDIGEIEETKVSELGFVERDGQQVYNPGLTGNTFSPQSWVAGITYARSLTARFDVGVTAKYAQEDLWLSKTGVPLFDFGLNYKTGFRTLKIATSVVNFGPEVQFVNKSYPAPLIFRMGAAADIIGPGALLPVEAENHRFTAEFNLVHPNDYDQQWTGGMEYAFLERFFLRGGYQINYDTKSFSLGGGIRQPIGSMEVKFDYSYSDMGYYFDAAHRLSLRFTL